eukprot:1230245-Heterocapsa_arctica.AAC.1
MIESDRVASLAVLNGIPHGTNIEFNLTDSFSDERYVLYGSILETLIGDYLGNQWDFPIICNDERVLEYKDDTEV